LSDKETAVLVDDRAVSDYFDRVVQAAADSPAVTLKLVSNWVSGELFRLMGESGADISAVKILPEHLVALINLVAANTINQTAAKQVFGVMFNTGRSPANIVQELGLEQISDAGALAAAARQVIADNPGPVEQFLGGKEAVIKFLVGQVMRATRGKANPQLAEEALREQLPSPKA
jgi:aspartyl-tRNA(Asn)/glutamyl-tRNA(Gln) amidotransferase subunit B